MIPVSPELIINGLRLLLECYKVANDKFKDKKTPQKVEKILTQAEKSPKILDAGELERSINEQLEPGDAAIVKDDLKLLSLLAMPQPSLDKFDYWGKLEQLAKGLQTYAKNKRIFELRGRTTSFGQVLTLSRTGPFILPKEEANKMPALYKREELKSTKASAFLLDNEKEFPIIVRLEADFYVYDSTGGPPTAGSEICFYNLIPGQGPHWLGFFARSNSPSVHFVLNWEYMLNASDFAAIVAGLRDDVEHFAKAIQADEEKIAPLFSSINAFAEKALR